MSTVISVRLSDKAEIDFHRLMEHERESSKYPVTVSGLINRLITNAAARIDTAEGKKEDRQRELLAELNKQLSVLLSANRANMTATTKHDIEEYNSLILKAIENGDR